MCYSNLITWEKCGHFVVRKEMFREALARDPPTYCTAAHAPVATDVDAAHGVCPDESKHTPTPERVSPATALWHSRLGITTTSGLGNEWYRNQKNEEKVEVKKEET